MHEKVYVGIHPDHPDGRYNGETFVRKRTELIQIRPLILLLADSTIEWMGETYDLSGTLIVPTRERSPEPLMGWDAFIDKTTREFPSKTYQLWGAELVLCNYGFEKYDGCVGEVYRRLISKRLKANVEEDNCFVIDRIIDWGKFLKNI
ncbi:MAG: hypothetical protein Q8P57_01465 [Candidatus Pacearchaeota archaeon]|nr:hypothetical protein [Candidatus Pacearchaeota archaeon]